jgi:2',3'-cyclic-nucleotide 2'-phosphodiesterase (5'-nucleotidase family)
MSGIEQHVDWTAGSRPGVEHVGPGMARAKSEPAPVPRRDVMETLLGKNNLTAIDASGADPYNATGRHFRR